MPNPNERKGFFWFLKKKKTDKKEKGAVETNTADGGANRASVLQPSVTPSIDTQAAQVQQPNTSQNLIRKKKKASSPFKNKTAIEEEDQMGASTKFVSVKAKMRPAPTKMRKRQMVLGKEQPTEVLEKKDVTLETEHEDEKAEDHSDGKSSEDVSVRLPVGEDQEAVKQLLCRNRRLEKENRVLKKLFQELKAQMDEQQEQLDRDSAELYNFVRGTSAEHSKDGSDEKPGVTPKPSAEPEKKVIDVKPSSEHENKDVVVANKLPAVVENKNTAVAKKPPVVNKQPMDVTTVDGALNKKPVVAIKSPLKPESKDGSVEKHEANPVRVKPPVTYTKTFHMFRGKLVPRYTPVIVPPTLDATAAPIVQDGGAKPIEKTKKNSK